ncbi:MAG: DUF898 domain-containing protein [Treponema sp.]|jgi:uncharacterized membrane protein YjgN (DUF898 family)|nr:DUF898 domain-containing protein [Treponema sp.]
MSESTESKSYFDGGVFDNFITSLVVSLITTITLGIGYPWAEAYRQKWQVKHTVIEGKRLTFDGTGGQLFGNYIKWWLLSIITLGIYAIFFMPVRIQQWITKHTFFEQK